RHPDELVVVLLDDERPTADLADALTTLATEPGAGQWTAARRVRFLGETVSSADVAIAWRGATGSPVTSTRLAGGIETVPANVTDMIDRLQALATNVHRSAPVSSADFVGRPIAAMARRLWRRRRDGIPGL